MKQVNKIVSVLLTCIYSSMFSGNIDVVHIKTDNVKKYENYLIAELELARGKNLDEAEKRFKWFADNVDYKAGTHGLLRTWFKAEKLQLIVQKTNDFDIDDLEIQLVFAAAYLNTSKASEAEELLNKLKKNHPQSEQVAYFYTLLLVNTNRVSRAISHVDSFLNGLDSFNAKHSLFYFLKAKIYVQLNKHKKAYESIDNCLELNPQFPQAILLKALLSEELKNIDDAIKSFNKYIDIVGPDKQIVQKLVMLLFSKKKFKEAEEVFKKVVSDDREYYFDLALIQAKGDKLNEALIDINKSLAKGHSNQARILKLEILLKSKLLDEAVKLVSSWISEKPSDRFALSMVPALRKSGVKSEVLINMLHGIVNKGLAHKNLLAILSDLYVDSKKLINSLPYHKQILKLTQDELLKSKTYYRIGYIYFVTGQKDKVEDVLKEAIATEEVFAPAYNLLAYYYADANKNLEYATWLIDKALSVKPKDPVFLDTKGYVFFKRGNKLDAKKLFRRALNYSPNDKIISEHMKLVIR